MKIIGIKCYYYCNIKNIEIFQNVFGCWPKMSIYYVSINTGNFFGFFSANFNLSSVQTGEWWHRWWGMQGAISIRFFPCLSRFSICYFCYVQTNLSPCSLKKRKKGKCPQYLKLINIKKYLHYDLSIRIPK